METQQKSLERVVSQKALQISSSFPCQICVIGFLCGVCLTSLFLAALTSFSNRSLMMFGGLSFSEISSFNSSSGLVNMVAWEECNPDTKETVHVLNTKESLDDRVSSLYLAWGAAFNARVNPGNGKLLSQLQSEKSDLPPAPHLVNCKLANEMNRRFDSRNENQTYPPWSLWKGSLDAYPSLLADEMKTMRRQILSEGSHPPWVEGSDEENYPFTRKAQRDIWLHQHPLNCHDPNIKFLVADWERIPGFGMGAQFAGMCGMLAIAMNEKRILVTNYYNRADHDGCKDSSRASWACYFFPETTQECRDRALELMGSKEAWERGIITTKENYSSKAIWAGPIPRKWGNPWSYLQPTTEINGSLISSHRKMDRRWWRAQALRYLMRFQTEYTCSILNEARHAAFGREAAEMVLSAVDGRRLKDIYAKPNTDIEQFVWSNYEPWTPRPMLSIHVRMGDKACEMKVVGFEEYMALAERIRMRFPHLKNIWLSTEMQEVIDKTRNNPTWKFHYSNVARQKGNMTMAVYEASLGRETSTNYPLVNFVMAMKADFFVGALGSTWCFLIDGMRNTGGKVMAGYLSVNKDRFW
ncbi:hypothetical protein QQ045_005768 [Rhodiola kirilowii]